MPVGRTFSFQAQDEGLHSPTRSEQEPFNQHYHDGSPSRHIASPPHYASPPSHQFPSQSPITGRYNPHNLPEQTLALYPQPNYSASRSRSPPSRNDSPDIPPPPPPHRRPIDDGQRERVHESSWESPTQSAVTSGMDNIGDQVHGGRPPHVARNPTDQRSRERGLEGQRVTNEMVPGNTSQSSQRASSASPENFQIPRRPMYRPERASYGSNTALAGGAATPGSVTPVTSSMPQSSRHSDRSLEMYNYPSAAPPPSGYLGNYYDSPYMNAGQRYNTAFNDASINPYDIADDGDDGFIPEPKRRSILSSSRQTSRERNSKIMSKTPSSAGSSIAPATAAGATNAEGNTWGQRRNPVFSGSYDPVRQGGVLEGDAHPTQREEKKAWLDEEKRKHKRMGWTVGLVIGLVIVLAIIGGAVGGILGSRSSNSNSDNSAAGDTAANGDLGKNSPEIVALMNNPNLHKVFPGIDYTPWGTQYPLCMTYPPSQNNVTRDMAVLSQLTNAVRLYGTDCNQTEMVLHSIDRLQLTNMKVWLGVWIDTNQTTTVRQLEQMYKILSDVKDISIFKGAIIGNEALYRAGVDKASSEASLIEILTAVKSNFTSLGYNIPVATSDLGDNWNGQLVDAVDMVMSNIHPFFAGVSAEAAAAWTIDFWDTHDKVLTGAGSDKKQIISETGWPSGGGTDCGGATGACATGQAGSVAGVTGMNTFLESWVCDALSNGTEYFWFEAFDEPWKIQYNTESQQWEDKWGLMDPARNLKSGLKIPDCGGATVDGKYT